MTTKKIFEYLKKKKYPVKNYKINEVGEDGTVVLNDRFIIKVVEKTEEVYLVFLNSDNDEILTELFDYKKDDIYMKDRGF